MNMKRMRGRNHRGTGGGGGAGPIRHHSGNIPLNRNHVFDSNGPDVRVRGTAQQLFEKYLQLGRDATSSGDRVTAESYFQHAEHYFRILNAINQAAQQNQPQAYNGQGGAQAYGQGGYGQGSYGQGGNSGAAPGNQQGGYQAGANGRRGPGMGPDDEPDDATAGTGDQPGTEQREIPIAAAPPEA
jgi:hypothetical protein